MIEEWDLTSTNLRRIRQRKYEVAVLPLGAIEPHNLHLPEGQDFLQARHLARRCCELAWRRCESVICLPTIPYGVDCNLLAFPMAIHVSQATLDAMVREILVSLRVHGIRKVVLFNGHGGNEFAPLVRQVQYETDVHVFVCDWWKVGAETYDEIFAARDDHGGEMETSASLHVFPHLVEMEHAADGRTRRSRFEAVERGWVRTSRDFSKLNEFCGVGTPLAATAEKGRQYLALVADRVSGFLVELARAPIDETFPQRP